MLILFLITMLKLLFPFGFDLWTAKSKDSSNDGIIILIPAVF